MTDVKTRPITQRAVSRRSEVQKSCFRFPLLLLPVRTSLCEWTVFVPLYCSSVFPRAYVLISFLAWSFSVLCSVLLVRRLATRIFSASLRGVYLLGTRGNRSFSHKFRLIASFHFEQHDEFAAGDNSHTRVLCCWNTIVNHKATEWNYWYYAYLNYVFASDHEWNVKKKCLILKKTPIPLPQEKNSYSSW